MLRIIGMSIKRKVMFIILLACVLIITLASASLYLGLRVQGKNNILSDLKTQAQILAANSRAAVLFEDSKAAYDTLDALKFKTHILGSIIFLEDKSVFVQWGRKDIALPERDELSGSNVIFRGPYLFLFEPITQNRIHRATLVLIYDFHALQKNMARPFIVIVCLVLFISLVLSIVLSSLLQRVITRPILGLANTARAVAEQKDYSVRAKTANRDEVGLLTTAFNQMLDRIQADDSALRAINKDLEAEIAARKSAQKQLEDLNKEMVTISHQAGMAEVATNVLHNVGNVLNSINVSGTLLFDRIQELKITNLERVSRLLEDHSSNLSAFFAEDPRAKKLPDYLQKLAHYLAEERIFYLKELELLRTHIDHIRDIVVMQQGYARIAGVVETIKPSELVEDALKLNSGSFDRDKIEIQKDFADLPALSVPKSKVLQILVNLLRNAQQACEQSARTDKCIQLRTAFQGSDRISIEVADNGVGILPEDLTRIFAHGFTTRKGGHGFGLHSGVLAARELGGDLRVSSAGLGKGASFVLELPIHPAKPAALTEKSGRE